ncbi:MAG: hypothetical protein WCI26_04985 [Acidimicrobiales bacterium]
MRMRVVKASGVMALFGSHAVGLVITILLVVALNAAPIIRPWSGYPLAH